MKRSYFNVVLSMLIFGTIGIFRRYIPLSSGILALSRGLLGGLFLLVFLKIRKKKNVNVTRPSLIMTMVTGAVIGVNWVLLFESYNYTTVQVATLSYYMEPAIVILLSPIFLGEKLTPKRLLCALSSVVGMVLVSGITGGSSLSSGDFKGILYGLSAAALYATVIILNKRNIGMDAQYKTMIELFSASIVIVPYILLRENITAITFTPLSILMLLLVGIFHTGFAYSLYFGAMEMLSAHTIAVVSYIDPVFALILSFLVLGESLTLEGLVGAVLIIISSLISEL